MGRSSSSSSSEDSSSEEEQRKKKGDKKAKKKKDKKVKKKLKNKKDKKGKKKKNKKEKKKKVVGAVTEQFGKYGVITDQDLYRKRPEFHAWLMEVKQISTESFGSMEEKRLFKDFIEDHNTATFTSKKYYDLDIWERTQSAKNRMTAEKSVMPTFDDEKARKMEIQQMRESRKERVLHEQVKALKEDSTLVEEMRHQDKLRAQMQQQFKAGNTEEAEKIQKRLEPEEFK
eukprot:GEMP01061397.1.p1 GENE.GEMP01061397.1~~GEMP01061397.1.p1  ORF type:complete len:229 (+),score=85.24 GEMP01061397.1:24-710(+)